MNDIAGWIAPIATMIAAMMTAANLGPRVTGWGFVVFTAGSLAWTVVAITTDQANLLWANGFLTLVNLVGIWRWLGREAQYDDGGQSAKSVSKRRAAPSLIPTGEIAGRPLLGPDCATIGHCVGAMAHREDGRLVYLVVREGGLGGVGERLHAIAWSDIGVRDDGFTVPLDADGLAALPEVDTAAWPTEVPALAPAPVERPFMAG